MSKGRRGNSVFYSPFAQRKYTCFFTYSLVTCPFFGMCWWNWHLIFFKVQFSFSFICGSFAHCGLSAVVVTVPHGDMVTMHLSYVTFTITTINLPIHNFPSNEGEWIHSSNVCPYQCFSRSSAVSLISSWLIQRFKILLDLFHLFLLRDHPSSFTAPQISLRSSFYFS